MQAAFVMAGGPAPIKSTWLKLPKAWLIGFYSSKLGHWHFTPSSPSVYKVDSDACSGTFQIQATSLRRKMVLKLHAATDGFAPLQCPTAIGFHIESVESFSGHAHIEAYEYQFWPWREVGWKLVEVVDMENTALEFGGNYRCQSQEQRSCDSNI